MWSILTTSPDHLLWTLLPSSPPSSSGTIQQVRLQGENYICAASPTPNCDFCRRVASGVWAGLRAEHSMLIASRSPHVSSHRCLVLERVLQLTLRVTFHLLYLSSSPT